MSGNDARVVTDGDVRRVVELLNSGVAVDWNGEGPQIAPRGRLLEALVETPRDRGEAR